VIRFQDLTVKDVMIPEPICLPSDATLAEAEGVLLDAGIEEAPILDEAGKFRGSCSLRQLLDARRTGANVGTVGGLGGHVSPTCESSLRLAQACQLMIRKHSRHVVVVEDGKPIGLVSCVEAARVLACLEDLSHSRKTWTFKPFEEGTHPGESA
jgi:CBS domain-containing protein